MYTMITEAIINADAVLSTIQSNDIIVSFITIGLILGLYSAVIYILRTAIK